MKRAIIGAALALVGVSTARADGPEPLRTALAREAGGKPVLLVDDGTGLSARTVDGSFNRLLVAGAARYTAHDPAEDLVWRLRGDTLEVVDLRAPAAVAVKIATGVAQESFEISGASSTGWDGDRYSDTYLELTWAKKPTVSQHSPVVTDCGDESLDRCERRQKAADKKAAKKVKLVGASWLKAQFAQRQRHAAAAKAAAAPIPAAAVPAPSKITLPAKLADCDTSNVVCYAAECIDEGGDEEPRCGQVERFGATSLQIVILGSNDTCALYDPARQQFAGLGAPTQWSSDGADPVACDAAEFDSTETVYIYSTSVCTTTAGCRDLGSNATLFWP